VSDKKYYEPEMLKRRMVAGQADRGLRGDMPHVLHHEGLGRQNHDRPPVLHVSQVEPERDIAASHMIMLDFLKRPLSMAASMGLNGGTNVTGRMSYFHCRGAAVRRAENQCIE